jgi:hypothetical protein
MNQIRVIPDGGYHDPGDLLSWAVPCPLAFATGAQDGIHI